jgi:hypothetical protein
MAVGWYVGGTSINDGLSALYERVDRLNKPDEQDAFVVLHEEDSIHWVYGDTYEDGVRQIILNHPV